MIYLAILLILCGLLIVVTALSVESGRFRRSASVKRRVSEPSGDFTGENADEIYPRNFDNFETESSREDEDIFINFDDEIAGADELEHRGDWGIDDTGSVYEEGKALNNGSVYGFSGDHVSGAGNDIHAVMYDDKSNIIDYESGTGAIDTTITSYKSIRRIGRGRIESDIDGLSFFVDERLYRFDFHKVYDVWSGNDYVALPLKGSSTVKLFIIENSPEFPELVEVNYREYEKGI